VKRRFHPAVVSTKCAEIPPGPTTVTSAAGMDSDLTFGSAPARMKMSV